MKFEIQRNDRTFRISFSGSVDAGDLDRIKLDAIDRALLDDVGSNEASAADFLLVLEMLFRRHAEQFGPKNKG